MPDRPVTPERLARALYETDAGHGGYPPSHLTIAWEDIIGREIFLERAREILRILGRS